MLQNRFAVRFSALLIGVIIGATLTYVGLAGALQAVVATPEEYRLDVARGVGVLMQSQCFNSTDSCCKYAVEMISSMPEGNSKVAYLQHLTEGLQDLVETDCIVPTDGCLEFAFSLVQDPATRSVSTHPLPHEEQ